MKENVRNFMRELVVLMKKHEIEYMDSSDHGYGCSIYIHGGWKNGIWLDPRQKITPEYLEEQGDQPPEDPPLNDKSD